MKLAYPYIFKDYPEDMHKFVMEVLVYRGQEYCEGIMSRDTLDSKIHETAQMYAKWITWELEIEANFLAIEEMVTSGELKNSPFASEVIPQLALGWDSDLHWFLRHQVVICPRNAVISFLAGRRINAILELEIKFGIEMDFLRNKNEPGFLDTDEGYLPLLNFSVL